MLNFFVEVHVDTTSLCLAFHLNAGMSGLRTVYVWADRDTCEQAGRHRRYYWCGQAVDEEERGEPVFHAAECCVSSLLHQAFHPVPPTLLQLFPLL